MGKPYFDHVARNADEREAQQTAMFDAARENTAVAAERLRDDLTALVAGLRDKDVSIGELMEINDYSDSQLLIQDVRANVRLLLAALRHIDAAWKC